VDGSAGYEDGGGMKNVRWRRDQYRILYVWQSRQAVCQRACSV